MKLIGFIFALIGAVQIIIGGFIMYLDLSFSQSAVKTQGTVVEIVERTGSKTGKQYYPVIEFRCDMGQRYTFEGDGVSSQSEYQTGKPVPVLYDPKDPNDAKLEGGHELILMGSIFGGIGLVFGTIGAIFLIIHFRRAKDIEWLKQNGMRTEADFDHVYYDRSLKVNGKSPYVIVCKLTNPEDEQVMTVKSERLWSDPAPFITSKKLTVLVDPGNAKRNYIDVSFLPQDIKREF